MSKMKEGCVFVADAASVGVVDVWFSGLAEIMPTVEKFKSVRTAERERQGSSEVDQCLHRWPVYQASTAICRHVN